MARKKRDPAAEDIAKRILAEYSPKTADEAQEALRSVFGPMIETMLKAELEAHLGYASNDKSPKEGADRRNGYTAKTVRTSAGEVSIDVPRDRDATFEPAVVPKGERDLSGIEGRVLSMYARGMSQRDIAATVREIYGFSMSAETVSAITDRIWEELERWRSRPLRPVYAFMFVDCLFVPVRRGRGSRNMAVYAIVAYDLAGCKDVLGLWMQESEGAHHWMGVFDELRGRGVEDVLFVRTGSRALRTACAPSSPRRSPSGAWCTSSGTRASTCPPPTCRRSAGTRGRSTERPRWRPAGPRSPTSRRDGRATRGRSPSGRGAWPRSSSCSRTAPTCAGSCTRPTPWRASTRASARWSAEAASRTRTR